MEMATFACTCAAPAANGHQPKCPHLARVCSPDFHDDLEPPAFLKLPLPERLGGPKTSASVFD